MNNRFSFDFLAFNFSNWVDLNRKILIEFTILKKKLPFSFIVLLK